MKIELTGLADTEGEHREESVTLEIKNRGIVIKTGTSWVGVMVKPSELLAAIKALVGMSE